MESNKVMFRRIKFVKHILRRESEQVQSMLKILTDCNFYVAEFTPLHAAVSVNSSAICLLLLNSGKVNINFSPRGMESPFLYALMHGRILAATTLLRFGANPRSRSRDGTPALFYCCRSKSHYSIFFDMIVSCPNVILDMNERRETCLHIAAQHRQHDIMNNLCDSRRVHLMKIPDVNGASALMRSAIVGDLEGYLFLMDHIAFYQEDYFGSCSLSYVLMGRNFSMLKQILLSPVVYASAHLEHCLGNCLSTAITRDFNDEAVNLLEKMQSPREWSNYSTHSSLLHTLAAYGTEQMIATMYETLNFPCMLKQGDYKGNNAADDCHFLWKPPNGRFTLQLGEDGGRQLQI